MGLRNFTPAERDNNGFRIAPAKGLCRCGDTIYLYDSMDNTCDRCGRNYNASGQEVTPMALCAGHDDY